MFSNFDLRTVGDAEYVAAGQSQLLDRKDAVESLPSKTVTKYMVSIFSARCVGTRFVLNSRDTQKPKMEFL